MTMQRRAAIAIAAVAGLSALAVPLLASARNRVEQPDYKVVKTHDQFELRRYEPRLVAEVVVEAKDPRRASNDGFRLLAAFIFGENEARDEIAMTSPVGRSQKIEMTSPVGRERRTDGERGQWTISFTMPSKWTMKTLPKPKNDRVKIRQIPARHYAVRSFSGSPSDDTVAKREGELRTWAQAAGYTVLPEPATYNRYDPPWVPSFARRNELWVAVDVPSSNQVDN